MKKANSKGIGAIHLILILALFLGAGIGYKTYKAHEKKAELARIDLMRKEAETQKAEMIKRLNEQKEKILLVFKRWDDALKLAGMTSRIALAEPVSQMQAVRRDMEELKPNECFKKATKLAVEGMNDAIFGFELFIRFPSNSVASESTTERLKSSSDSILSAKQVIDDCIPVT
jgi:hypothetical protein